MPNDNNHHVPVSEPTGGRTAIMRITDKMFLETPLCPFKGTPTCPDSTCSGFESKTCDLWLMCSTR